MRNFTDFNTLERVKIGGVIIYYYLCSVNESTTNTAALEDAKRRERAQIKR